MQNGECSNDVMQYIGLKDKNGKEIYEEDIVKINDINWKVVWNEYQEGMGYCLMPYSESIITREKAEEIFCVDCEDGNDKRKEIEVIGNIYENPELLKEK